MREMVKDSQLRTTRRSGVGPLSYAKGGPPEIGWEKFDWNAYYAQIWAKELDGIVTEIAHSRACRRGNSACCASDNASWNILRLTSMV